MLEELDLVHSKEPAGSSAACGGDDGASGGNDDGNGSGRTLDHLIADVRASRPTATAKEVHELLALQEGFSNVTLSAVKRACAKVAKVAAASRGETAAKEGQGVSRL